MIGFILGLFVGGIVVTVVYACIVIGTEGDDR